MMPPKQSIRVYHCSERTSYCFNDSKKSHNIEAYILEKLKDMGIDNGIELYAHCQKIWILKTKKETLSGQVFKVTIKNINANADNIKEERIIQHMSQTESIYDRIKYQKVYNQTSEKQQIDLFDPTKQVVLVYHREQLLFEKGSCQDFNIKQDSFIHYIIEDKEKKNGQYLFFVKIKDRKDCISIHANPNSPLLELSEKLFTNYKIEKTNNIYLYHQKLDLHQTPYQLGLLDGINLHLEIPTIISNSKFNIELCFKYNDQDRQILVPLDRNIETLTYDLLKAMNLNPNTLIQLFHKEIPLKNDQSFGRQNIYEGYIIHIISEQIQINQIDSQIVDHQNNLEFVSILTQSTDSQDYNQQDEIQPGLCIRFKCNNQQCVARSRDSYHNFGCGMFVNKGLQNQIKCVYCKNNDIKVTTCYVYKCEFYIIDKTGITQIMENIGLEWKQLMCTKTL